MTCLLRKWIVLPFAALALCTGFALSATATGEASLEIASKYLQSHQDELGVHASDLAGLGLQYSYVSAHNGVTHYFFKQHLNGLEVVNGDLGLHITPEGRVLHVGHRLVSGLHEKAASGGPVLLPEDAVARAASHLGAVVDKAAFPALLETRRGPAQEALFAGGNLSQHDIPVGLKYYADEAGGLRLVWDLSLQPHGADGWWNVWVDATSGEIVAKSNWVDDDSYNVYALPKESPSDGPRSIVNNPANPVASPFAWHDTNGVAGAEFTDTRGNNVFAQEDTNGNNAGGFRPDGGPTLDFNFPLDLTMQPSTYIPAAVTNLFYWNNIMHDVLFLYGFDEAAGNFQEINYTGAPGGGDPVLADAQDGSGTNNANFATPPDGFSPRMQMFEWTPPPTLTVNLPVAIAGDYTAGGASFGAPLNGVGVSGIVELVNDGDDQGGTASVTDACQPLVGFTAGRVALIDRGACEFGLKVLNAENAGAVAAIVVNNQGDGVLTMGPGVNGGSVTISSVFIGQSDGDTIKNNLAAPVDVTLRSLSTINRDSDLDNGIIAHEYGHGLSNRLTGGRLNINCLNNQEQAGEGWSDWLGLTFTAVPGDGPTDARGVGTYVVFEPSTGLGIRNFPYTTDLAVNPQTYADVGSTNIPHGVGEIWASMLWEMYWRMVERDGFDKIVTTGGGNGLALQLSIDGMKLQSCSPGFVDARDAILAADVANNGGVNECVIWKAFAKRGLGASASQGSPFAVGDEVEAFDIPVACQGFLLSGPQPGVAGVDNDFFVTGATASNPVHLLIARQTGSTTLNVGACGAVNFGLGSNLARFARTDSTIFGDGVFSKAVNANLSGQTVHFQAFDPGSCSVSNVLSVTFP